MTLSMIAAMSDNRVIGVSNSLPWNIPEDLRHFREITSGHPVIMGRKTFESIGRPLPKRRNIVISRQSSYRADGIETVTSLESALALKFDTEEVFIIGGAEIYRQALPFCQKIYLTVVHQKFEGDAFFPETSSEFETFSEESHLEALLPFSFKVLVRINRN